MIVTPTIIGLLCFAQQISHIESASGKIWSPGKTEKWESKGANIECSESRAVLAKRLDGIFFMDFRQQQQTSLNEVVLPQDGAVVVPDSFQMGLAAEPKCTDDNYTLLKQSGQTRSWFDSNNWMTNKILEPNAKANTNIAKPHIDRIPCECDTVLFPSTYSVSIDLELVDKIVVDHIKINNHIGDFTRFLETEIGQRMFSHSEAVTFERGVCTPPKHLSCHSFRLFHEYLSIVCGIEAPKCPIPLCLNPVQPRGHCCLICGALMDIRIRESSDDFRVNELEIIIERKLRRFRNGRYKNSLQYWIGFMPDEKADDKLVQLIVAESDEYAAVSVEFMNFIMKDAHFIGSYDVPITTILSGIPYQPNAGWPWFIVLGTLFFVVIFYGIIYTAYERQLEMFNSMTIRRLQPFRQSVMFARFGNHHADESEGNDNATVEFNDAENAAAQRVVLGFNNPLFKSENQWEQVAANSARPPILPIEPTSMSQNDTNDADDISSIKLVNVELEYISDSPASGN